MRIGIIGTGHVGLVTGVALASLGHQVVATDVDQEKLRFLSSGKAPFFEPGLDELLGETLATGSLRFALDMAEAVRGSRVVFICVGRPPVGNGDRSVGAVEDAARSVAAAAQDDVVVVVKSTVPPGTTRRVAQVLASERPSLRFDAASSPEFLREGHAIADTLRPDRLVVGACGDLAVSVLRDLYAPIVASGSRWVETDPESAELSKLASNAFLALKVSFANALARVAERSGADVRDVTDIMGGDERIGPAFLGAGLGFGGYCLPKISRPWSASRPAVATTSRCCAKPSASMKKPWKRSSGWSKRPCGTSRGSGSLCSASRSRRESTTCAHRPRSPWHAD